MTSINISLTVFILKFVIKGIIIGILVSAPMGPIGVLCIQKTVNKGKITGFLSGLGAATADTVYAVLAVFSVTFVTDFLNRNQTLFELIGISILLILGFRMIFNNPIKQFRYYRSGGAKNNFIKDYISVFFLTISNPLTIIFFGAAFTALGLINNSNPNSYSYFVVFGVFGGASLWWFFLASIVEKFRKKFKLRNIIAINRVSGIAIILLCIIAIIKFFTMN